MQPARSCSRAAWSKSAARKDAPESPTSGVTLASPRDGIVGKVLQLSRHRSREQVVDCGQVLEDLQRVRGVHDVLGRERPEQVAIRVAQREVRRAIELQALRLEPHRVHRVRRYHSGDGRRHRSEEHTSELQSRLHLVCRLLLEKKKKTYINIDN